MDLNESIGAFAIASDDENTDTGTPIIPQIPDTDLSDVFWRQHAQLSDKWSLPANSYSFEALTDVFNDSLSSTEDILDQKASVRVDVGRSETPLPSPDISSAQSPTQEHDGISSQSPAWPTGSCPLCFHLNLLCDGYLPCGTCTQLNLRCGEKAREPFRCNLCPKRFTRLYNLRTHLRKHQESRDPPNATKGAQRTFAADADSYPNLEYLSHDSPHGRSSPRPIPVSAAIGHSDESDGSWNESDNEITWQDLFQKQLYSFVGDEDRISFVTRPLSLRQRTQVHGMAHLRSISHMSVGAGKNKTMILTKCRLHCSVGTKKRWNPAQNMWPEGIVDPRLLTFSNIMMTPLQFQGHLRDVELPIPSRLAMERNYQAGPSYRPECAMHAFFENPADAVAAYMAFDRPCCLRNTTNICCEFPVFPSCSWGSAERITMLGDLWNSRMRFPIKPGYQSPTTPHIPVLENFSRDSGMISPLQSQTMSGSSSRCSNSDNTFYPSNTPPSNQIAAATNQASLAMHNPANASVGSNGSYVLSDYASDVSRSKRKRMPYSVAGYECQYSCGKVFDHAGERTKHEKVHQESAKTHVCDECEKKFMYPKDLRRHQDRTGHVEEVAKKAQKEGVSEEELFSGMIF